MTIDMLKEKQYIDDIEFILHRDGMFAVSRCGKILGRSGKILKPKNQGAYLIVSYQADLKKIRHKYVHRLVAETFISNPNNLPYVNHLDGNKLNNYFGNLEWCTPRENSKHAICNGLAWNLPQKGECGFRSKSND
jgi:hypothetical protein